MINVNHFNQRMAEHITLIDRVNREGWMRAATEPTDFTRTLAISTVVASIRQRMGAAVVHTGERLQGTAVLHAADPSAL